MWDWTKIQQMLHPFVRQGWRYWVRFALLLAAGTYVGHILSESERFTDIRFAIYQYQTRMQHRGPIYPQHTVLLLLNDGDYWGDAFASRDPLKRDQLALLLDRLDQAGVNTVALDLDFFSPRPEQPAFEYPEFQAEDRALFEAMQRMCANGRHVVLASALDYALGGEQRGGLSTYVEKPLIFTPVLNQLPCVTLGYEALPEDMRRVPGLAKLEDGRFEDSLALAMVKIEDPVAYANVVGNSERGYRFAQFLTPEDFSTRNGRQFVLNGEEVRQMETLALRHVVADKVVIVGAHWHPLAYGIGDDYTDMHLSPGGAEPGAMLHANYVEAMEDSSGTFTPLSDRAVEMVEWGMVLGLALLGVYEVGAGVKWAGFLFSCVLSILLTYVLLQNLGLFLDFFIPFLMIVVHTLVEEILEMRRELTHTKHELHSLHRTHHQRGMTE